MNPPQQELEVHEAWKDRAEVFGRSYVEMQLFLTKKDDEIRSLISTMSFLTIAGVTLFIFARGELEPTDIGFHGHAWNLANFFFGCFLMSLFLSIGSSLVALDPHSHRPNFLTTRTREWDDLRRDPSCRSDTISLVYYKSLLNDPIWFERIDHPPEQLWEGLARSFLRDARLLAERVDHKIARFADAQAFASMSIITLIALAFTRLPHSSKPTKVWAIIALLIFCTLLPIGTYHRMRLNKFPRMKRLRGRKRGAFILFYCVHPALGATLAFVPFFDRWLAIFHLVGWNAVARIGQRMRRGAVPLALAYAGATILMFFVVSQTRISYARIRVRVDPVCETYSNAVNRVLHAKQTGLLSAVVATAKETAEDDAELLDQVGGGSKDPRMQALVAEAEVGSGLLRDLSTRIKKNERYQINRDLRDLATTKKRIAELAAQQKLANCVKAATRR